MLFVFFLNLIKLWEEGACGQGMTVSSCYNVSQPFHVHIYNRIKEMFNQNECDSWHITVV